MSRLQRRTPSPSAKLALGYCRSWPSRTREEVTVSPEYVFLAAGMGKETVKLVKEDAASHPYTGPNFYGPAFWGDDSLKETPSVNRKIGIFGGGDGALQDVLRALTRFNHPLEFMRFLEKDAHVKIALSRVTPGLLAAERQGRQFGAWTIENGGYLAIDRVCKEVAEKLSADSRLVRKICQGISFGRGSVALYVRGKHFDKAYLLNRFLIHLIWACYGAQKSMWSGRVGFQVVFGHQAVGYVPGPNNTHEVTIGLTASGRAIREVFDTIAVRYGITAGTPPGSQLIQVSTKRSRQRTSLARVELPFVVDKT